MECKSTGTWQKTLWKFVTNPTVEVVAAIAVVILSAWVVVQAEIDLKEAQHPFPVPLDFK
ncbi:MAG TPA: hypothetical protein VFK48_18750 [Usitatibacter sp.]|nr:hypothetical protein [Usitatibacter sp.]